MVRRLANVIARLLSIIFERFLRSEMDHDDWRKTNTAFVFRRGKNNDSECNRLVNLPLVCEKIMEQVLLKHTKKEEVIESSQHGLNNKKLCLTNVFL